MVVASLQSPNSSQTFSLMCFPLLLAVCLCWGFIKCWLPIYQAFLKRGGLWDLKKKNNRFPPDWEIASFMKDYFPPPLPFLQNTHFCRRPLFNIKGLLLQSWKLWWRNGNMGRRKYRNVFPSKFRDTIFTWRCNGKTSVAFQLLPIEVGDQMSLVFG